MEGGGGVDSQNLDRDIGAKQPPGGWTGDRAMQKWAVEWREEKKRGLGENEMSGGFLAGVIQVFHR